MGFDTDRKFWGWGRSSHVTPEPLLQMARAYLELQLGAPAGAARPIPELGTLRMSAAAIEPPQALAHCITTDRWQRAAHTYGKAYRDVVRALSGDFSAAPDLVAYPETEEDVTRLLAWATAENVAVIPFGGGSSVVGGIEPDREHRHHYAGVLTLDMCQLNRVLELDRDSRCARVQAGTYGPALEAQLKPHGYTLRHFPQSFEFSTVGGWIATRAGGHYATLYTHIDDFVESVRLITPRGVLQSRRLPGNGAGPQEDRLVLGSEGAFGVISEAWLRVQDLPRYRAGCTVRFEHFEAGVAACRGLSQSGLFPSNARLIEAEEAMFMGAGDGASHVLVLAFESAAWPQEQKLEAARSLCEQQGGRADPAVIRDAKPQAAGRDASAEQWKQSFMRAPYLRDELARMGYISETFETCTTWAGFESLDRAIRSAAQSAVQEQCGAGKLTCRFTHLYPDGPAAYYTVIAPGTAGREVQQWDAIKDAVSNAIVGAGATITHHHAVGKDHRPYFERQSSPISLAMLQAAKSAVDPTGIMNPGTLLPRARQ